MYGGSIGSITGARNFTFGNIPNENDRNNYYFQGQSKEISINVKCFF